MGKADLTIILLTYNEEVHIKRVIGNTINRAKYVYVLDSYSTDSTLQIAEQMGANVFTRKFDSYVNQRSYSIKDLPIKTDWVFILDADELLTDELKNEVEIVLNKGDNIVAYFVRRKFYWQNKWLRFGTLYEQLSPRLVKHKYVHYNPRAINEHLEIEGATANLKNPFLHVDLKPISDWVEKHNKYSTAEAEELYKSFIRRKSSEKDEFADLSGSQPQKKRWIREHIWNPFMPPLIRPFIYFFYRYFLRLGFLDGKAGFVYHFLQGLWYPFLIDVKYLELKRKLNDKRKT